MRLGRNHRTPPTRCPWCDKKFDAASGIDHDNAPDAGALTVCSECGGVGSFGLGLQLTRCPEAVWQNEAEPTPTMIRNARRAILAVHSRKQL